MDEFDKSGSDSFFQMYRLLTAIANAMIDPNYRQSLLAVLARLDQLSAEADAILAAPGDAEIGAMAEELRELHADMRAKVEEKLDRVAEA